MNVFEVYARKYIITLMNKNEKKKAHAREKTSAKQKGEYL